MNMKVIAIGLIGALLIGGLVLTSPCTVESRQFVCTPDGYIEEPCTLHTQLWAKVLWDLGYDLYYADGEFSAPGSF